LRPSRGEIENRTYAGWAAAYAAERKLAQLLCDLLQFARQRVKAITQGASELTVE
jgi:hypothetical protein